MDRLCRRIDHLSREWAEQNEVMRTLLPRENLLRGISTMLQSAKPNNQIKIAKVILSICNLLSTQGLYLGEDDN